MISLGIESTAHTFGVGICTDKGKMLANQIDQFTTKKGGIMPAAASEHHVNTALDTVQAALDQADITLKDVDIITFSQGPGIGQCLRVGAFAARSLASINNKPLVGVNHCVSHLEVAKILTGAKDPVLLYASGANTQVIALEGGRYRVMGETLDIGIGNLLDVFAREIDLGFPGGPKVEKLALEAKDYIEIPYVVKGMDVSFGGILTNLKQKVQSKKYSKADLCYSLQETVFAMLVEIAERALAHSGKDELALGGGVACNSRLQEMAKQMCKDRGAKFYAPEKQFLVDNGAMIAWSGILNYKAGNSIKPEESPFLPLQRTDDVDAA